MSIMPSPLALSVLVASGGMYSGGLRAWRDTMSVNMTPSTGGTTGLKVLLPGLSSHALYNGAEICGFGAARLASEQGMIVPAEFCRRHSVQLTSTRPVPSHSG